MSQSVEMCKTEMKDTFSDTKIFHQTVGFAITFEKSLDPVIHWPKIVQFRILLREGQKTTRTTRNKLVHGSKNKCYACSDCFSDSKFLSFPQFFNLMHLKFFSVNPLALWEFLFLLSNKHLQLITIARVNGVESFTIRVLNQPHVNSWFGERNQYEPQDNLNILHCVL